MLTGASEHVHIDKDGQLDRVGVVVIARSQSVPRHEAGHHNGEVCNLVKRGHIFQNLELDSDKDDHHDGRKNDDTIVEIRSECVREKFRSFWLPPDLEAP